MTILKRAIALSENWRVLRAALQRDSYVYAKILLRKQKYMGAVRTIKMFLYFTCSLRYRRRPILAPRFDPMLARRGSYQLSPPAATAMGIERSGVDFL